MPIFILTTVKVTYFQWPLKCTKAHCDYTAHTLCSKQQRKGGGRRTLCTFCVVDKNISQCNMWSVAREYHLTTPKIMLFLNGLLCFSLLLKVILTNYLYFFLWILLCLGVRFLKCMFIHDLSFDLRDIYTYP